MQPCLFDRVEFSIGGSTRLLRCDLGTLWRIERESGEPWRVVFRRLERAVAARRNPQAKDLRLVLWALLDAGGANVDLKTVGSWGTARNTPEILGAMFSAIASSMPIAEPEIAHDGNQAATSASESPEHSTKPRLENWAERFATARRRHGITKLDRFWSLTLREWEAMQEVYEQEQDRLDFRNGVRLALEANRRRDPMKNPVAYEPEDFMLRGALLKRRKPLRPKQTYQEQKAILLWAAQRHGAYMQQQKQMEELSKESAGGKKQNGKDGTGKRRARRQTENSTV